MSRSALDNIVPRFKRIWRASRVWRRVLLSKDAIPALLVLCTLVLGEPLACIIHCELLVPASLGSHVHHHHNADLATLDPANTNPTLAGATTSTFEGSSSFVCYVQPSPRAPGDIPSPLPPSPVHEVVTMVVALLAFLLLVVVRLCERVRPKPHLALPPPLRPPISFAA